MNAFTKKPDLDKFVKEANLAKARASFGSKRADALSEFRDGPKFSLLSNEYIEKMNKEQIPLTNLCKEILGDVNSLTNVFTGNGDLFPRMLTGIDELDINLGKSYNIKGIQYGSLNLFFTESTSQSFYFETILESINKHSTNIYLQGGLKFETRSLEVILELVKNFDKTNAILAFKYVGNFRDIILNVAESHALREIRKEAVDKKLVVLLFALGVDEYRNQHAMENSDNAFNLLEVTDPNLGKCINCVKIDALKSRQGTRGFSCKHLF